MRLHSLLLPLLFLFLLAACGENAIQEKTSIAEGRVAFPDSTAETVFGPLRPETQTFTIDAGDDTLITGKNGTTVFVAQHSFVNANGEIVSGSITIELIEVLTVSDFVRSNMQTVSDGKLLQSEGMLYVDARADGQQLELAPDKKLQIEIPTKTNASGQEPMQIFSGNYDSTGQINWSAMSKPVNRMICLPLELFNYQQWTSFPFQRADGGGYSIPGDATVDSVTLQNSKLENTFIATREFEERMNYIDETEWTIGRFTSFESPKAQSGIMIRDSAITNLYVRNTDKPLWYCDFLVGDYLESWDYKVEFNVLFRSEVDRADMIVAFQNFYNQRLEELVKIPDSTLGKGNLRKQLEAQGFSGIQVDQMLNDYAVQERLINERRDSIQVRRLARNSFEVAELGWTNCDRFLNQPGSEEIELLVSVTNNSDFNYTAVSLVVNNESVVLDALPSGGDNFQFAYGTKKTITAPVGKQATLIAISYKDGVPWFASQEITLTEKGNYGMKLEKSTKEQLDFMLMEIN